MVRRIQRKLLCKLPSHSKKTRTVLLPLAISITHANDEDSGPHFHLARRLTKLVSMPKDFKADSTRAPADVMAATTTSSAQVQPLGGLPPVQSDQTIQDVAEFEGTTYFTQSSAATHRYKISLRNSNLRIWLEDCESKGQWCTSELSLESYVNLRNAVPDATASEYVENFHVLLGAIVEDADEIPRAFKRTKDESFLLEITMKFQVLTRAKVATYSFDLEPISVGRIDVLESRVRDLQEQVKASGLTTVVEQQRTVKKFKAEISDLQRKIKDIENPPLTIEAQASGSTSGNAICWSATGNYSNGSDGSIRNLQPGTYLVTAAVNYNVPTNGEYLELIKGGQRVQVMCCNITSGNGSSGVLACSVRVVKGDQLSVVSTADVEISTSHLTLTRVGN